MRFNNRITWSPVEVDFLKDNRETISMDQLTVMLAKSRNAIIRKMKELDGEPLPGKKNKKSVIGKRKDLNNIFFRSSWESNSSRYFNHIGWKDWLFEPKQFFFSNERKGAISYLPDFYIPSQDIYVEVKGQLDSRGRSAVRKFKKYYPKEFARLRAITGGPKTKATLFFKSIGVEIIAYYLDIDKQYRSIIPNWE